MSIQQSHPQEQAPQRRSLDQSVENLTTGSRMQRQPEVFLKVFQLGLRDLGVGILPLLLRSIAPFEIDSKIISSYLLLLWKTKMRKDTNLQKKVYCNSQYFHGTTSAKNRLNKSGLNMSVINLVIDYTHALSTYHLDISVKGSKRDCEDGGVQRWSHSVRHHASSPEPQGSVVGSSFEPEVAVSGITNSMARFLCLRYELCNDPHHVGKPS